MVKGNGEDGETQKFSKGTASEAEKLKVPSPALGT